MKDEHDNVTIDLADILGESNPNAAAELMISKRYALVGYYQAVLPPTKVFEQSGARWLGSKTPDVYRDSWQTPKWLFNYFSKMAGGFQLDAAADDVNHLCAEYFTEEDDGLSQEWPEKASVWLNPPYSDPYPWVEKAIEQVLDNNCTVYMLLPDDISNAWFRLAYDNAAEAYMLLHNGRPKNDGGKSGRVRFVSALTKKPGGSNNKGSWVFIFRRHRAPLKIHGIDRTICENHGDSFF